MRYKLRNSFFAMEKNRKLIVLVGLTLVVFLIVAYLFFARKSTINKGSEKISPTEEVIPTVDNTVKVDLAAKIAGKEVVLNIRFIPIGTSSIEYSLSYSTRQQGLQGVIGTITVPGGSEQYEKQITLGTCSSGTCVYHEVMGRIKLTLKFNGDYGEKLFEKEYEL